MSTWIDDVADVIGHFITLFKGRTVRRWVFVLCLVTGRFALWLTRNIDTRTVGSNENRSSGGLEGRH